MKTLYLDCGMGAAGDMLAAALMELLPDPDTFIQEINALEIPGIVVKKESSVKCGITGTHLSVTIDGQEEESCDHVHDHKHEHEHHHEHHHDHKHEHEHTHHHAHHHHSSMHDIAHIVETFHAVPKKVREDIMAVYGLIAEAESKAHGVPVTEIHFHEVGTMDAIADITAVCLLINKINPDEIVVSPVHVGSGQVHCAHGILPVPAPATAYILKDVPIYGGAIKGELCTPTGAALLKHFATRFGDMPVMKTQAIGYGMGKKDFPAANCVRALLGETADQTEQMLELSCNVDDMTAEQIGFAMERLLEGGALDVYTIPIGMKKSRPGILLRVMCRAQQKEDIVALLFKHTSTIGVRETQIQRYVLSRTMQTVHTQYGDIRRKISAGYGVTRAKYEYEDLARIAVEHNMSIDSLCAAIEQE